MAAIRPARSCIGNFAGTVISFAREHWANKKGRHQATLSLQRQLQSGLDLESPSLKQWLRDVLRILVPACPLAQPSRTQVLVWRKLVLAHHLLEFGHSGDHRP